MRGRTYISIAAAGAIAAAIFVAPPTARSSSGGLSLTAVDREPAEGRIKPTDAQLAELRAAVDKEPKDREARFRLVQALIRSAKLDDALAAAKAWREKDAYNLVVVRLLGDIYTELGDRRRALRAYSAVVELLPKDHRAQRALASVLKQSGAIAAARSRLEAAATLRPEDVRLRFELADAAQRMSDLDAAEELFAEIVADDDANQAISFPAKQRLAQIYSERRRVALAANHAADAAALAAKIDDLAIKGGAENDIKIYLTWDTDRSDVDLWVTNPAGEKVFYSNQTGRFGGSLFHDVTTGYGPESFTAREAKTGTYVVEVNYFGAGRSAFPEARGEVVVVLDEGSAAEKRHVLPYRLFREKQTVTVARIVVQ